MLYVAVLRRLYLSNNWRWGIEPADCVTDGAGAGREIPHSGRVL